MHMVIRAIVYAKNKEDGIEKAKEIFDRLCGEDGYHPFDYYTMFGTADDTWDGQGSSRWGKKPTISLASSKAGQKLIQEGFEYGKNDFYREIHTIRNILDTHSDNELFEEGDRNKDKPCEKCERLIKEDKDNKKFGQYLSCSMFKHCCYSLGEYQGGSKWLYNNDGDAISSTAQLKDTLEKYACLYKEHPEIEKEYRDLNVYVVPADVHY